MKNHATWMPIQIAVAAALFVVPNALDTVKAAVGKRAYYSDIR